MQTNLEMYSFKLNCINKLHITGKRCEKIQETWYFSNDKNNGNKDKTVVVTIIQVRLIMTDTIMMIMMIIQRLRWQQTIIPNGLHFFFFHVPVQLVNTAPFPYFLSVTCLHVLSPCRRLRSALPHLWLTRQLLWSTCQRLSSTRQHLWSTRQHLWSTRQLSFSITRPLPWSSRQLLWSTNQRLSSIRLHPWSPRLHLWSPYLHLWTLSRLAYI